MPSHEADVEKYAEHRENKKCEAPAGGLPTRARGCTDAVCLLLLVAHWAVTSAIGLAALGWVELPSWSPVALEVGHPELLYRGVDHNGFTCGVTLSKQDQLAKFKPTSHTQDAATVDAAWAELNYLYYPDPLGVGLTVASGPNKGKKVRVATGTASARASARARDALGPRRARAVGRGDERAAPEAD